MSEQAQVYLGEGVLPRIITVAESPRSFVDRVAAVTAAGSPFIEILPVGTNSYVYLRTSEILVVS